MIVYQLCIAVGVGALLALMQERTYRLREAAAAATREVLDG